MRGITDGVRAVPIGSSRRGISLFALTAIAVVLLIFAGLLPMASWRPDEYHDFGKFRTEGWSFFFQRLFTWSPRPLSEALAGLYHLAVMATGEQLTAPFLALLWATLLIGPVQSFRRATPSQRPMRMVFAGAILCFFLLDHAVSEVFFWPMGAVAYLPTLAAITALTFQVIDGRWQAAGDRRFAIACALCAAGSSEVGAIFAIFFAATMAGLYVAGRFGDRRPGWGWLAPLALGLVVMAMLAAGRGRLEEHVTFHGLSTNPTYLHHPWASVKRSLPTFFRQLVALNAEDSGVRLLVFGAGIKALIAIGLTLVSVGAAVSTSRATRLVLVALAACLLVTFFVSIAGSYYKFGMLCCERHDTVRQGFLFLALACGAVIVAGLWPAPMRLGAAGIGLLGLSILALLFHERSALSGAYAS